MKPIINSLADTDLYKLTMLQAFLHRHPDAQAEYRFVCRNQAQFALATLLPQLNAELDHLCTLRFTAQELDYLFSLGTLSSEEKTYFDALYGADEAARVRPRKFIKRDFIEFLRIFQLNRSFINASARPDGSLASSRLICHLSGVSRGNGTPCESFSSRSKATSAAHRAHRTSRAPLTRASPSRASSNVSSKSPLS